MSISADSRVVTVIMLGLVLLIPVLMWWFTMRARKKKTSLRSIEAFEALQGLVARAAENGQVVHLALGRSELGNEQTAVASTGLAVLRNLAEQGAAIGISPIVTVSDPTLMLAAQNVLDRAFRKKGRAENYRPTDVHMIAPDPTAYAIGTQDTINGQNVAANVMIGHLGEEYLLMGEPGAQREITQLVGSNTVPSQPLMFATCDQALLGEEVFAAGAYLSERPDQVASLYVQDVLRVLIVIVVVLGVLVKTVLG